jgi:hypothetical protein
VAAQELQKRFADKQRRPAVLLKVGNNVLISMKHFEFVPNASWELAPRFIGPLISAKVIGSNRLACWVELIPPFSPVAYCETCIVATNCQPKQPVPPVGLPYVIKCETY